MRDHERSTSHDDHELHLAVNQLAPVLPTRCLAPLLRAAAPARVVNVASAGQATRTAVPPEHQPG